MNHQTRSRKIIDIINQFEHAIRDLDALQVGDVRGEISPIKHAIMDAIAGEIEMLRKIGAREYAEPLE